MIVSQCGLLRSNQELCPLCLTAGGDIAMVELLIEHPPTYQPEREYICDVVFSEFLGIEYQEIIGDDPDTTIVSVRGDSSGKRLVLPEALFSTAHEKWLTEDSLPHQPLDGWMLPDGFRDTPKVSLNIPVIYGQRISENFYYEESGSDIRLGLDILGSAFFMLTRYEEVVRSDKDEHDRFPVTASLAYQEGFLERPIINEYLEILWTCLKRLWPGLERKQRQYQVVLSHDVDQVFSGIGSSVVHVARNVVGDIIKRKDAGLALRRMLAFASSGVKCEGLDSNATFDFVMDISDKYGCCSAFYFMAAKKRSRFDDGYAIGGEYLRRLLRRIAARGHEIGFHASYNTFRDPMLARAEVDRLSTVMDEERISRRPLGGRQHYLRWEAPTTWRIWDQLGLTYDSTVGFPYDPGFRAGICYQYPVFDLLQRTKLRLIERPLLFMEASMLTPDCSDADARRLVECIGKYSAICRMHDGELTILWHSNNLRSARHRRLYEQVIATAMNR